MKWIDTLVKLSKLNEVKIFPILNPYQPEFSDPTNTEKVPSLSSNSDENVTPLLSIERHIPISLLLGSIPPPPEREWRKEEKRKKAMIALLVFIFATLELLAEKGIFGSNVFKISCKTSRGISTHFADDVWSSCVVDPGESTYAGFGTFNAGWYRLMQLLTPDYNHL